MISENALSLVYVHMNEDPKQDLAAVCASVERRTGESIEVTEAGELVATTMGLVAAGERWYKVVHELVHTPTLTVLEGKKKPAKKKAAKKKPAAKKRPPTVRVDIP